MKRNYVGPLMAIGSILLVIAVGVVIIDEFDDQVAPIYDACEKQNWMGTVYLENNSYDCECYDGSICEPYYGTAPPWHIIAAAIVLALIGMSLFRGSKKDEERDGS